MQQDSSYRASIGWGQVMGNDPFPKLPPTPALLIEKLKESGEHYTTHHGANYVKESDLPFLIGLLDSKEPCAFVRSVASSISFSGRGRSTVGREAAYLIEGYRKGSYPPGLTSQRFNPDIAEIRAWYNSLIQKQQLELNENADLPSDGTNQNVPQQKEEQHRETKSITDPKSGRSAVIERDGRTVSFFTPDGKVLWSVDVIAQLKEPIIGKPVVRHLRFNGNIIAIVGKHAFVELAAEDGAIKFLGSD